MAANRDSFGMEQGVPTSPTLDLGPLAEGVRRASRSGALPGWVGTPERAVLDDQFLEAHTVQKEGVERRMSTETAIAAQEVERTRLMAEAEKTSERDELGRVNGVAEAVQAAEEERARRLGLSSENVDGLVRRHSQGQANLAMEVERARRMREEQGEGPSPPMVALPPPPIKHDNSSPLAEGVRRASRTGALPIWVGALERVVLDDKMLEFQTVQKEGVERRMSTEKAIAAQEAERTRLMAEAEKISQQDGLARGNTVAEAVEAAEEERARRMSLSSEKVVDGMVRRHSQGQANLAMEVERARRMREEQGEGPSPPKVAQAPSPGAP